MAHQARPIDTVGLRTHARLRVRDDRLSRPYSAQQSAPEADWIDYTSENDRHLRGRRGLGEAIWMPVADDPLWKEWLTAEKTLGEARDQLRTVEHLDLGHREFQEAWQAYRLALEFFNPVTNKL